MNTTTGQLTNQRTQQKQSKNKNNSEQSKMIFGMRMCVCVCCAGDLAIHETCAKITIEFKALVEFCVYPTTLVFGPY